MYTDFNINIFGKPFMLLSYPFSPGGAGSVFSFRFPDMGQIDFELKTPLGGVLKRIRPNPPPSYCGTSTGRESSNCHSQLHGHHVLHPKQLCNST